MACQGLSRLNAFSFILHDGLLLHFSLAWLIPDRGSMFMSDLYLKYRSLLMVLLHCLKSVCTQLYFVFYFCCSHRFSLERKGIVQLFFFFLFRPLIWGWKLFILKNAVVRWGQIRVLLFCVCLKSAGVWVCPFKLLLLQFFLLLSWKHHGLVKWSVHAVNTLQIADCVPVCLVTSRKHSDSLFGLHPKLRPSPNASSKL